MWIAAAVVTVIVVGVSAWLLARRTAPDPASTEPMLREQLRKSESDLAGLRAALAQEQQQRVAAETRLEAAAGSVKEQRELLADAEKQLKDAFSALSSQALNQNNQAFLTLASQSFQRVLTEAKGDLGQRQEAIKGIVDPLAKALNDLRIQVVTLEQDRAKAYGELEGQLKSLTQAEQELRQQAENLVTALRAPHVRGRWGEMTLRRVVELAGMSDHCDFAEQVAAGSAQEGRLRPDLVIHLPAGREVVVDAKTSLDAYLTAVEACSDEERDAALKAHAEQLRTHLKELSSKEYWSQFPTSPEFVVMFIPGEAFFSAALKHDRTLLEDGMADRVVLASPATLVALLKAVAYGWRQEQFAKSAQVVADLGKAVYERFVTYVEHVRTVGSSLGQTVSAFNKMAGSLETRVLPGLRRFKELGATGESELSKVDSIEALPREIAIREGLSSEVKT